MLDEKLTCGACEKTKSITRFNHSGYYCDTCELTGSEKKQREKERELIRSHYIELIGSYRAEIEALCDDLSNSDKRYVLDHLIHVYAKNELLEIIYHFRYRNEVRRYWLRQSRGNTLSYQTMKGFITNRFSEDKDRAVFLLAESGDLYLD